MQKPRASLRRPPILASVEDTEAFIAGAQAPKAPDVQASKAHVQEAPPVDSPLDVAAPAALAEVSSGAARERETARRPDVQASAESVITATVREEAPKASSVQTSKRLVIRTDGRELRRLTVYLPNELARTLAVRCAEEDREMSEFIADAVRTKLAARV